MKSNTCRFTETEILLQLFIFKSCSAEGGINLLIVFYRQVFCIATQQEKAIIINNTLLLLLVSLMLSHKNMQQFSTSTEGPNKSGSMAVNSVLNGWQARNDKTDICNLRSTRPFPGRSSLKGDCNGQTGLCPSEAGQAAFLEEQRNLSTQSQQCNLAFSEEKRAHSGNVRELQVLKV